MKVNEEVIDILNGFVNEINKEGWGMSSRTQEHPLQQALELLLNDIKRRQKLSLIAIAEHEQASKCLKSVWRNAGNSIADYEFIGGNCYFGVLHVSDFEVETSIYLQDRINHVYRLATNFYEFVQEPLGFTDDIWLSWKTARALNVYCNAIFQLSRKLERSAPQLINRLQKHLN